MTKFSNHRGESGRNSQSSAGEKLIIGPDVLAFLLPIKHPFIMVDRVISYISDPLSLSAERYISANERVFIGHFPNLKLWPGIYTMEGLRQACYLLHILDELRRVGLLSSVQELNKRYMLQPQIDHQSCQDVIDYMKSRRGSGLEHYSVRMKFLEPVFAGSLISYHCSADESKDDNWIVKAMVNDRIVANGTIAQSYD